MIFVRRQAARRGPYKEPTMQFKSVRIVVGLLSTLTLVVAGCASHDLLARQTVSAEVEQSDSVQLSRPSVLQRGGVLDIAGNVSRKPGYTEELAGHVMITLVAPNGKELVTLPATIEPALIPAEGSSYYTVHIQEKMQPGSVVRVSFEDKLRRSIKGAKKEYSPVTASDRR
jgi:hypothetical protein